MMSPNKWTDTQKERAEILFSFLPLRRLRMIFSQKCSKNKERKVYAHGMAKAEFGNKAFNDIAALCMTERMKSLILCQSVYKCIC